MIDLAVPKADGGWAKRPRGGRPDSANIERREGEGSDGITVDESRWCSWPSGVHGGSSAAMRIRRARPEQTSRSPSCFARDVRPILSDHCFACHGPDDKARKAGLRLDTQEGAFAETESGARAIVPGKPGESELIARIESDDPDLLMPPKKSGKPLTPEQIAVLRRWVEQGAAWTKHWAFKPPVKPATPAVKDAAWPINAVDRFILARLEEQGLEPEAEADQDRAHPPRHPRPHRPAADPRGGRRVPRRSGPHGAYENVVDRLLDSPRYGEHMARFWLDAARYGDTHGLHLDNYREIWPYRDWVIRAFNDNKPFDRFIVEQLAGDLLPNPTLDQIVATGFNRCHVSTNEGGSIEEEVYVRNIVDQVDTNGTVFLGLSTGCARCHDHKYDPIRAKDYYQLFAFFNNIDGPAMDGNSAKWAPVVAVPTAAQRKAVRGDRWRDRGAQEVDRGRDRQGVIRQRGEGQDRDPGRAGRLCRPGRFRLGRRRPASGRGAAGGPSPWKFVGRPDQPVYSGRLALANKARGLKQFVFENAGPKLVVAEGDALFAHVYLDPKDTPREVMLQWHTAAGWSHRAYWGQNAIDWGKDGTPERLAMGELPAAGRGSGWRCRSTGSSWRRGP